jgi:nucleoside-diphosphate-sugar epimerase
MTERNSQLVLVTGGTGFIGVWCIIQLLSAGYSVRTTIRSQKRESDVRDMLKTGEATNLDRLSFAITDLNKDEGWKEAVNGCTFVLHVASPFPAAPPKHENDLIVPAREGTLRVLRAARDAGVKRVVITSSFASIGYGHLKNDEVYTEETWSNTDNPKTTPYQKSKTFAERAAWDFIKDEGGSLELAVINPVGVWGPVLGPDFSTSILLIQRLLNGSLPGCPQLSFGVVDVRDVADLHLRAMTDPKAKGERFIAASPPEMMVVEMAKALRERMPEATKKVPKRELPNFLLRIVGWFDPAVSLVVPQLGTKRKMTNEKAKRLLGWQPRSRVDALQATAESLISLGLVK